MAENKGKFVKVGVVRTKADGEGNAFISLGDNYKKKDKKYELHTEIRVTDGNGDEVAYVKDGMLTVLDPRKNPRLTDDQVERIPSWLLKEIFIVDNG